MCSGLAAKLPAELLLQAKDKRSHSGILSSSTALLSCYYYFSYYFPVPSLTLGCWAGDGAVTEGQPVLLHSYTQPQPCMWVQPQPSPKQRPPFHVSCVASNYGNTDAAQITLAELR